MTHSEKHSTGKKERCNPVQSGGASFKKQRKKSSTIALAILAAASFGLAGFKSASDESMQENHAAVKGSKSLLILSKQKEKEAPGLYTSTSSENWQKDEKKDLRNWEEANRIQTNKINLLKKQLTEAEQKLYELKAHLFTKGDPSDRIQLAEISKDLVEKERAVHELSKRAAKLEKQNAESFKKIKRMESTIEALATMTDTQREAKEQAVSSYQVQLEQLQESAHKEHGELKETIAELTESQQKLKEALSKKLKKVKNLEHELAVKQEIIQKKTHAAESQAALYSLSEKNMNQQLQDMFAELELQVLLNNTVKNEKERALAQQSTQKTHIKAVEEKLQKNEEKTSLQQKRFKKSQTDLASEHLELYNLLSLYAHTNGRLEKRHAKILTLLKNEKEKAVRLEADLKETIAEADAEQQRGLCLEEELHKTAQKVLSLSDELSKQHLNTEKRNQEFDTLAYSHASLKDQLSEKISQLTASLDEEKKKIDEQDQKLLALIQDLEQEKARAEELEDHLKEVQASAEEHKTLSLVLDERLNEKSDLLANKQDEVFDLKDKIQTLKQDLETEKRVSNELQAELKNAISKHEVEFDRAKSLEKSIDGSKKQIHDLLEQLDKIELDYQEERQRSSQIEEHLLKVKAALDEKEKALTKMQSHQTATSGRADALKSEIGKLQKEKEALSKKNKQQIQLLFHQQEVLQNLSGDVRSQQEALRQIEHNKGVIEQEAGLNKDSKELPPRPLSTHDTLKRKKGHFYQKETSHFVQPGETLDTLSVYYYSTPERWIEILNANKHILKDKDTPIRPGTKLRIFLEE